MVLLYNIATHSSWEGLYLFWGVSTTSTLRQIAPRNNDPMNIFSHFAFLKMLLKMRVGGNFSTQPQVSLDASRGVATSNRYNGTPPNELVTYKLG